jgi:hypothetical protein
MVNLQSFMSQAHSSTNKHELNKTDYGVDKYWVLLPKKKLLTDWVK